jgi:hypothetical protein
VELACPSLQQVQRRGIEREKVVRPLVPLDETDAVEDAEVLVDRREGQLAHGGQLVDRRGLLTEETDDLPPVGVGERGEEAVELARLGRPRSPLLATCHHFTSW